MFDFVWWKWISNWSIISCLYLVLREFFVLMLNIIGTPLRKVMMICNNLHAIMLFWVQWTLTTLKYFYRGKKSLYLYSAKNFFPYLMCDIINLLIQTQHPHCVYRIRRPNKQTPFMGSNKFSYQGWRSALVPFIITRTQSYRCCHL